ncbi:peptide chain release factor H [Pinibacter aurantiacus]|uniref:Peptide chain release factor H n=1 Tax=Pinibacter aurantiacus TaxID=2851599 RepID=A0A9E2SDH8_9BACT|nr:peptide chain release factor H [Pinibacter aurantiacus]MBV4359619.1 peptide chain release factor H [Pinibacter aurantiacus]
MDNLIYIQISSGRGPAECERVVAKVQQLFLKEAAVRSLSATVIDKTSGQINGTLQSTLLQLQGENLKAFVNEWEGTIQWIGKSPYRKFHKRKNWFVSVQSFSPSKEIAFDEKEVEFKTCRASGPGGQNVNKTETAVRATHIASGISVMASDTRSQHQNKKLAIERLQLKIKAWQMEEQMNNIAAQWNQHTSLKRGDAVRVLTGEL